LAHLIELTVAIESCRQLVRQRGDRNLEIGRRELPRQRTNESAGDLVDDSFVLDSPTKVGERPLPLSESRARERALALVKAPLTPGPDDGLSESDGRDVALSDRTHTDGEAHLPRLKTRLIRMLDRTRIAERSTLDRELGGERRPEYELARLTQLAIVVESRADDVGVVHEQGCQVTAVCGEIVDDLARNLLDVSLSNFHHARNNLSRTRSGLAHLLTGNKELRRDA